MAFEKRQTDHQPIDSQQFTKSRWDNLLIIGKANDGMLVVKDAVAVLLGAKVYPDRLHARNAVYSTLFDHKQDVQKAGQGVYRLRETSNRDGNLQIKNVNPHQLVNEKTEFKKTNLHLKEPLQALLSVNPNITRDEAS